MDEVLSQLNSTFINGDPGIEQNKTEYDGMYKNWGRLGNQDQRRRDILDVQKSNRNSNVDTCRGILNLVNSVTEQRSYHNRTQGTYYRPSIYVSGFTKASTKYRDVLMMSEWMIEKPIDFEDNWYVVPCPKGVRILLVACRGETKLYNKYGNFKLTRRTALPGGNPCDPNYRNHCVILDCFYVESINTLYVLDVLAWKNQPMTDGETDFRDYWMKSHIEEISELKTINAKNKIIFKMLPKYNCDSVSFNKFMMTCPYFANDMPPLDGLLFYHKQAHYVSGTTPLVGWLYPFMVNEVLGSDVTVNPKYVSERPADYVNQEKYIDDFEKKYSKKKPYKQQPQRMDTSADGENGSGDRPRRPRKPKQRRSQDAEMAENNDVTDVGVSPKGFQFNPQNTFLSRPRLVRIDQEVQPSTATNQQTIEINN